LRLGRFVFDPGISLFLTAGIVLVIVVLMTATTFIDVQSTRSDIREAMMQTGQDFAAIANGVLPDAMNSGDVNEMGRFASALWAQRDTSYVKIYDREGRQLVGPGEDQFPQGVVDVSALRDVADLRTNLRWTDDGLEVTAPVTSGARLIGAVRFGFDKTRLEDESRSLTIARIYQTLFLVSLGVAGSILVSTYFVRPIQLLARATHRIAEGDLSTRIKELRGREMRDLGSSFNSMAGELEQMVGALHESRRRIVTGEEQLRREIASQLHGSVQGHLWGLVAQLDAVQKREELPPDTAQSLSSIIADMGRIIETEIAVASHRLYPDIVRRGLVPSQQSLCDDFDSSLNIERKIPPELIEAERTNHRLLPESIRLAAYRISNEALTNVVKHAASSRVTLSIGLLEAGWLTVSVADDGPGFDTRDEEEGLGLAAMRDYAEAVGGMCTILSRPGGGTRVIARLPATQD
jgi:signal transduction histidine kinase